jgi:hypothetical protein
MSWSEHLPFDEEGALVKRKRLYADEHAADEPFSDSRFALLVVV